MVELYNSEYYGNLNSFLKNGWTIEEINIYFPVLESLTEQELLKLHKLCNIKMFSQDETVDKELAIHALVNLNDTPKKILLEALERIK